MQNNKLHTVFFFLIYLNFIESYRTVCYWDHTSMNRHGYGQMSIQHLQPMLPSCTHLIPGFFSWNDIELGVYDKIHREALNMLMEWRRTDLKIHLGVGCSIHNRTSCGAREHLEIIRGRESRNEFIQNVSRIAHEYGFDGIDLSWPCDNEFFESMETTGTDDPHGSFLQARRNFPGLVDDFLYRRYTTIVIHELAKELNSMDKNLTLTVLPRTRVDKYEVSEILSSLDAIHLLAFDYETPYAQPTVADYVAPLRGRPSCVDHTVRSWLGAGVPADKIILGVATFARTWVVRREDFQARRTPPYLATGPGHMGEASIRGLANHAEVCTLKVPDLGEEFLRNFQPHRSVGRMKAERGFHVHGYLSCGSPIWACYDNSLNIRQKAIYAKQLGLGGMGAYDLSTDDFRDICINLSTLESISQFLKDDSIRSGDW